MVMRLAKISSCFGHWYCSSTKSWPSARAFFASQNATSFSILMMISMQKGMISANVQQISRSWRAARWGSNGEVVDYTRCGGSAPANIVVRDKCHARQQHNNIIVMTEQYWENSKPELGLGLEGGGIQRCRFMKYQ